MNDEHPEICICAAVKAADGTVIRCHRHSDGLSKLHEMKKPYAKEWDAQGFITSRNRYVNREEGRLLQQAAGIPSADKDGYTGKTLFSEDLY